MKTQKTLRGRGCLRKLPEMAEKFGIDNPMIVAGKTLSAKVRQALGNEKVITFSAYHANPDLEDCMKGAALFRESGCDGLVSAGGGSAIDTAKTIKALLSAPLADGDRNVRVGPEPGVPHIAVPGTAGSGSEASDTAVVYSDGKKLSLSGEILLPEGAVLDADMLATLPLRYKQSSALDALAQGIESYWSRAATDDSRVHAYLAILGVLDNLKAYLSGDAYAETEMMDAAHQGGKAIRITRTTAAHAMSYQITKQYGIDHGCACMMTLPLLWETMTDNESMLPILEDISSKIRLGDVRMAPKLLKGILYSMDMAFPPMPDEEALETLAASVNAERLSNHPVPLSHDELKQIYRKAFTPPCNAEKQACLDIWTYYGR